MNFLHQTESSYIQGHLHHLMLNLHTMSIGNGGFWTLNLDTLILSIIAGSFFLVVFYIAARFVSLDAPGVVQNFVEIMVEFVQNLVRESYYVQSRLVGPLALTIFVWVFLMNFMDLIPVDLIPWVLNIFGINNFRCVPTDDPNLTFAISLTVFGLIIFYNFYAKGFYNLSKEIICSPFGKWLFPLNILFRLLEDLVKPLSLSLRLYGNMFAGELIFILIAIVPWWGQWSLGSVWSLFHLLVIGIQAFIFMMLTIIYISMAGQMHA